MSFVKRETVYIMVKLQVSFSLYPSSFLHLEYAPEKPSLKELIISPQRDFNLSLSYFRNSTWGYFIFEELNCEIKLFERILKYI